MPGGLPAHHLYAGNLFTQSFKLAEEIADDVHILSALHGLVNPHSKLAPYDLGLNMMTKRQRSEWGRGVATSLSSLYEDDGIHLIFFAGRMYIDPVIEAISQFHYPWTYSNPMSGLGLFQRNKWLKEKLENSGL